MPAHAFRPVPMGALLATLGVCAACAGDIANPGPVPPPSFGVIQTLELQTFDGSGEVVHPDQSLVPAGWGADTRYLAITPYPGGRSDLENPSLFTGPDGAEWRIPPGVTNPIARPSGGHLSDPDEIFVPETAELWIYYRQVTSANEIYLIRSRNGVQWGAPARILTAPNHQIISPSVVRRSSGEWLMWAVNGGAAGCQGPSATVELRRSANGIDWSPPHAVSLSHGELSPWHIDVIWVPSRAEYWALYNAKTSGSCTTAALFLATSPDGVEWTTIENPVLVRGAIPEFRDIVYRSTMEYDPAEDAITFWYSGASFDRGRYVWRSAVEKRRRPGVFGERHDAIGIVRLPDVTTAPPLDERSAP
ncbi:MAG: hypothetical protein ACREON_08780 [Gemmatimonadaceae bacterium]